MHPSMHSVQGASSSPLLPSTLFPDQPEEAFLEQRGSCEVQADAWQACMAPVSPEKVAEVSGRSQGSTTNSVASTLEVDEEQARTHDAVDIKRLMKQKAEQEQKLKMLKARVKRLTDQERRVWKDVTCAQQMSLQAQESQWRRQAQQADRRRLEREVAAREQALREKARRMREQEMASKDAPRLSRFEANKAAAERTRQDSHRLMAALQEVREQTLQNKQMQVECQRQQRRQQKLRKELDQARREQAQQDINTLKFAELQEEMQSMEAAIAAAECEELSAVSRLQNSQTVRAEAISQLQATRGTGAASSSQDSGLDLQFAEGLEDPLEAAVPSAAAAAGTGPGEALAAPAGGNAGMLAGARSGSRSSPRLVGGSPHSVQQAFAGAPPPSVAAAQQQQKLGGSRSAGALGAWAPGRAGLGQITEEDEVSPGMQLRSPVERAVEEFRQQVATFQAQSQQFKATAEASTLRLQMACQGSSTAARRRASPQALGASAHAEGDVAALAAAAPATS